MKINTLKNSRDYDAIAKRIEELVDDNPRTPGALELKEHICTLIAYEQNRIKRSRKSNSNTNLPINFLYVELKE